MAGVTLISCATTQYVSEREIDRMDEISTILRNYSPQLHDYFMEGVLDVISIKEVTLKDGTVDYRIRTSYLKYYYPNRDERLGAIKEYFPDIYRLYMDGYLDIVDFYKYVDKNDGQIKHHISVSRVYDVYYSPLYGPGVMYPGFRLRYEPRPTPTPRPEPKPAPAPQNRPQGRRR